MIISDTSFHLPQITITFSVKPNRIQNVINRTGPLSWQYKESTILSPQNPIRKRGIQRFAATEFIPAPNTPNTRIHPRSGHTSARHPQFGLNHIRNTRNLVKASARANIGQKPSHSFSIIPIPSLPSSNFNDQRREDKVCTAVLNAITR